jgi:DNA-binding FrmR family transcriptional regulator
MHSYEDKVEDLDLRLKRIEGQIRGIRNMLNKRKYCVDVIHQIAAVKGALKKVELQLLDSHTRGCVADAMTSDNEEEQTVKIQELIDLMEKML